VSDIFCFTVPLLAICHRRHYVYRLFIHVCVCGRRSYANSWWTWYLSYKPIMAISSNIYKGV